MKKFQFESLSVWKFDVLLLINFVSMHFSERFDGIFFISLRIRWLKV
jgi:hypothetical protein